MKKKSTKAKQVKLPSPRKRKVKVTPIQVLGSLDEVVADSITEVYDEAELADIAQQKALHGAISSILKQLPDPTKESAKECVECGDKIPGARRKALPGVTLCVNCQSFLESRNKLRKVTADYKGD